ncbi:MAG: hypothetical protein NWE92_09040 [Candidatus Bathyarchaeota archaeon]|nr:hypothetical protein [Candidatus Bathyarchaeota archaeon]
MELWTACEEKQLRHTETTAEKRCNQQKQPQTQAILWKFLNRNTHTKREKPILPFE